MAKKSPRYIPGWKGHLLIDGENVEIMGWTGGDVIDENDLTTNDNGGWSTTEAGVRTATPTFSIPPLASSPGPPVVPGDIWPMTFDINGTVIYDGDFIVTGVTVNSPIRGAATYDITCKNYGDVSPTP